MLHWCACASLSSRLKIQNCSIFIFAGPEFHVLSNRQLWIFQLSFWNVNCHLSIKSWRYMYNISFPNIWYEMFRMHGLFFPKHFDHTFSRNGQFVSLVSRSVVQYCDKKLKLFTPLHVPECSNTNSLNTNQIFLKLIICYLFPDILLHLIQLSFELMPWMEFFDCPNGLQLT